MKKNLKNLFTSRDSIKGYVDSSLFYDESMGAFIINDEKIAKDVLKSKSFTAFRKQDQIESLSTSNENKRVMTEFYNHWLMYQKEGVHHTEMKRALQRAINQTIRHLVGSSKKAENDIIFKENVDVIKDVSEPFVVSYLSQFYGLNEADYHLLLKEGDALIEYIMTGDGDGERIVTSIQSVREILKDLILKEKISEDGFIRSIIHEAGFSREVLDIILNLVIDGHRPFLSSVNSLIYEKVKYNLSATQHTVKDVLKKHPPFPYIRRVCVKKETYDDMTIEVGDHVLILIYTVNDTMKGYGLTFGHGIHYCLGVVIVTLGLERLLKLDILNKYDIENYEWMTTFGFKELSSLHIKKTLP